jgi:CBS domain-containing protein
VDYCAWRKLSIPVVREESVVGVISKTDTLRLW